MFQTRWRQLPLGVLVLSMLVLVGCSGLPHTKDDMDRARAALDASLAAWKDGKSPDKLAEPVNFLDDEFRPNQKKLLEYTVEGSGVTDKDTIRFTVRMTIQDRRGKKTDRSVTYAIEPKKTPIVVARDPYF
jgi:hypothetical protein